MVDVARYFVRHLDGEWSDKRIVRGLSSGEGLIFHVRDKVIKIEDGEEVTVDPGVEDKRMLATETELGRTFKSMNREGNTLSAVLREAWDCADVLSTLTKNSSNLATAPLVSVIGHVTVDELKKLLNDTEQANGFGNRFLWVCVRRSRMLPDGGAFYQMDWTPILDRLQYLFGTARGVQRMVRDDEARDIWHSVYPAFTEGKPGLIGAMLARAEAQTMRLACVYALLDGSAVVKAEHLMSALAVWEYCEA